MIVVEIWPDPVTAEEVKIAEARNRVVVLNFMCSCRVWRWMKVCLKANSEWIVARREVAIHVPTLTKFVLVDPKWVYWRNLKGLALKNDCLI